MIMRFVMLQAFHLVLWLHRSGDDIIVDSTKSEHDLVAGVFLGILKSLNFSCIQRIPIVGLARVPTTSSRRLALKRYDVLLRQGVPPRIFNADGHLVRRA